MFGLTRRPKTVLLALGLCVLIPGAVQIVGAGFDGLLVKDSYAYFEYAVGPLRTSLRAGTPSPPFFWPPGYPLLVVFSSLIVGSVPLAGQVVSLLAAASVPIMTALLAREVWPDNESPWRVPLVAGALVAFLGQLWESSVVVMSDTTGLAAATVAMWSAARFGNTEMKPRSNDWIWLALAAAAMAFAILTRWGYALVAFPCGAYAIRVMARNPRRAAWQAMLAASIVVLILSPLIAPVLEVLGGNATIESPPTFAGNLVQRSWDPMHAFQRDFTTADGHIEWQLPMGLWYALAPAHWRFFTPVLALLIFPGLWFGLPSRSRGFAFLIVGWATIVYLFLAGDQYQGLRVALMYAPPLAILIALGAVEIGKRLRPQEGRWFAITFLGGLLLMAYGGWTGISNVVARKADLVALSRWVEASIPANAQLLVFGPSQVFRHESTLQIHDIFFLQEIDLQRLVSDEQPTFALFDINNVITQWKDRSPDINYRWLRDGPGLRGIGRRAPYTLFRVSHGGG